MKKYIQHPLAYGLLLGTSLLAAACGTQKAATRAPREKVVIQSTQRPAPTAVASSLEQINLINRDESIHPALLNFMKLFGIAHDGTITSVNQALQTHFLRKPGIERRDIQNEPQNEQKREKALHLLRQMGMVDEIDCHPAQVDYFLIFGAMTATMMNRIQNFENHFELKGGFTCNNVVLLGGVRQLKEDEIDLLKTILGRSFQAFCEKVGKKEEKHLTEADAFRALWDTKVSKSIKSQFQEGHNLFFINSIDVAQGTNGRPTTGATLEAWHEMCQPKPGHCHGNVEMPYGIRMEKTLRTFLQNRPENKGKYTITWNSPAANKKLPMGVYKDELARTFYQECKLKGYL